MKKYACKKCGAELFFDPKAGKLHCEYCDSTFDPSEFEFPEAGREGKDETVEQGLDEETIQQAKEQGMTDEQAAAAASVDAESTDDSEGQLVVYSCPNCGAQVITSKDTVATTCVYCNKAITLEGNLAGAFRPDYVLPFTKTQEDVEEAYNKLCKASILTPFKFRDKKNIKKIKGMYIPFWLYDFTGMASFDIRAEKIRTWRSGDMEYTEVSNYRIDEVVKGDFDHLPADALKKMDNTMMDSIEPFDFTKLKPFNPAYLAGFYTQKWDDSAAENEPRVKARAKKVLVDAAMSNNSSYTSRTVSSESYNWTDDVVKSAMVPVWMMYTEYKGKNYIFGMNGQTGKLMGEIPKSKGTMVKIGLGVFFVAQIVLMIIRILGVMV